MNIQLSVTLWTLICFVLLMLILNNLLFKPILECMDKRRERIEAARAKKIQADALLEEQKTVTAQKIALHQSEQKKLIKERVETLRSDQKKTLEAAKEVRLHQIDAYRVKIEEEQVAILQELDDHVGELAYLFADSVVKG